MAEKNVGKLWVGHVFYRRPTLMDEIFAGIYLCAFVVTRKKSLKSISRTKRFRHLFGNKFSQKKKT